MLLVYRDMQMEKVINRVTMTVTTFRGLTCQLPPCVVVIVLVIGHHFLLEFPITNSY